VAFICLTIDYLPGPATPRLGGGLSVVMGCGFFADDALTRSVRRSWSGCGCIPPVRSRLSLPGGCPRGGPSRYSFEGADAAFASGSPFDGSAEGSASFELLSGQARFPLRGMTTVRTPRRGRRRRQLRRTRGRRSRSRCAVRDRPGLSPVGLRSQLWCVSGVSGLHIVIENDAVVVVDDLPVVTELDRFPQPALRDRPRGRPVSSLYASERATLAGRRPVTGGQPRSAMQTSLAYPTGRPADTARQQPTRSLDAAAMRGHRPAETDITHRGRYQTRRSRT
jgi:hypothetical protein